MASRLFFVFNAYMVGSFVVKRVLVRVIFVGVSGYKRFRFAWYNDALWQVEKR